MSENVDLREPLLCRLGIHRYRHVSRTMPPGSIPERDGIPSNPFAVTRGERRCRGCFKLDPRSPYADEAAPHAREDR